MGYQKEKLLIELVEEMILRLTSVGIYDIDTIADILGLPRDILDISVGDLHVKDLAYHSSGKCILTAKGRESLSNLAVSKREKDSLQNVYVDAITGEITGEKNQDYIEGRINNSIKLKHLVDANAIEQYRRNMGAINDIFEKSMKIYLDDNNMLVQDELVSIDTIDDLTTGFIVVPINIYVSEGGMDIDVIASNKRQKSLIENRKSVIIEQMLERKLLSNVFVGNERVGSNPVKNYDSESVLYSKLKSLLSIENEDDFEEQACEILFASRKLYENELIAFCKLVLSGASTVEILIDELNYWSKNIKFTTIGSLIKKNVKCRVVYNNVKGATEHSIKRIRNSCPNILHKDIVEDNHVECLQIKIDSKIQIDVCVEFVKVFNETLFMPRISAYISSIADVS